jgi:hypothetical protein
MLVSAVVMYVNKYRVLREFILPSELPAEELRHLPRKMPPRGTTF